MIECSDCGRADFRSAQGLANHRRTHAELYPPLTDDSLYEFLPWWDVQVEDRGFESECWVVTSSSRGHYLARQIVAVRDRVITGLGSGLDTMHVCERWGEHNRCVRPEHIKYGTHSENLRHSGARPESRAQQSEGLRRAYRLGRR